jgi:hypothetical protein
MRRAQFFLNLDEVIFEPLFFFFFIGNKTCIKETQSAQNVHPREQHYNKEI